MTYWDTYMRVLVLMYDGLDGAIERARDDYLRGLLSLDGFEDQLDWLLGIRHA